MNKINIEFNVVYMCHSLRYLHCNNDRMPRDRFQKFINGLFPERIIPSSKGQVLSAIVSFITVYILLICVVVCFNLRKGDKHILQEVRRSFLNGTFLLQKKKCQMINYAVAFDFDNPLTILYQLQKQGVDSMARGGNGEAEIGMEQSLILKEQLVKHKTVLRIFTGQSQNS